MAAAKRRHLRRKAALLLAVLLGLSLPLQAAADKVITLSFAGDCTLGGEELTRNNPDSFDRAAKEKGYSYFFANFREMFSNDDCTVVNCEGVLSDSPDGENKSKSFRFRGTTDYANLLRESSIEAVSLANNHTLDYGERGLKETKQALTDAGVGWAWDEDFYFFEKDGIRIAFVSIDFGIYRRTGYAICDRLNKMRKNGEIQAVVLLIHEGTEYAPKHNLLQDEYVDYFMKNTGVDLIVTTHAHVLQGIRIIKNRTVFYSLGNFVFGGHNKVSRGKRTNSLYTMAVQAKLYFSDDGKYRGQQVVLYPAYSSGKDPVNNYQPVRIGAKEAEDIMAAVQADTEWKLPSLQTDGNGLAYAVLDYLPADGEAAEKPEEEGMPEAARPKPGREDR